MRLLTKRLILRKLALSDVPRYYEMGTQPDLALYAGFPTPRRLADSRKHVRLMLKEWKQGRWARREFAIVRRKDGEWLGSINLRWPHHGVGEVGYSLHPRHWGNGYAAEALARILRCAFEDFGAHRVQATTWVKNRRSARVLRKAKLRREGRLRGYLKREGVVRDEYLYAITRKDWLKD